MSDNKDYKIIRRLMKIPKDLKEFINTHYNEMVDDLNYKLRSLSLVNNFDSQVIAEDQYIAGNDTIKIEHSLGVMPSYMLVLRQYNGGTILLQERTNQYVMVKNSSAQGTIITIALYKG